MLDRDLYHCFIRETVGAKITEFDEVVSSVTEHYHGRI